MVDVCEDTYLRHSQNCSTTLRLSKTGYICPRYIEWETSLFTQASRHLHFEYHLVAAAVLPAALG